MDRRTTIARLLGQKSTDAALKSAASLDSAAVVSGLVPYSGPFGFDQAAHLLRRATFGATYQQMKDVANMGLDAAMELLLAVPAVPDPPVNPNFTEVSTWLLADVVECDLHIGELKRALLRQAAATQLRALQPR